MLNLRSKVFRDAIHGLISIDDDRDLFLDLINTPEFQRLRRIKQLGVSSLTYPNAEHTRFAHSLGVFHVATRILDTLQRRYRHNHDIACRLTGRDVRNVKVAALLHDLGHGPFSHVMEHVFPEATGEHEKRSQQMIVEECSGIRQVLESHSFTSTDIETVQMLLEQHEVPYLHDIISSTLDADRMDYLLRDSHFTGVKYGSFDLEWLINSFCLGYLPKFDSKAPFIRLCLDRKRGQHAAEQLIVARAHMTMQVYGHAITRLWEAHLLMLFAEATALAQEDKLPPNTPPHVTEYLRAQGKVPHEKFLLFDEPSVIASMSIWATSDGTSTLKTLSSAFLNREKILGCRELPFVPEYKRRNEQITQTLSKAIGDETKSGWKLDCYDFSAYHIPKEDLKKADPEAYWSQIATKAILLSDGDINKPATPLEEKSVILNSLGQQRFPLTRIYYRKELEERIRRELDSV